MKNILQLIMLAGILFCYSCDDEESGNIFPEKYVKILSLKESGDKLIRMNTTQEQVRDSILVLKGGGKPNSESTFSVRILSKDDAALLAGYELDEIEIIPEDSYKLPDQSQIIISADESYTYVPIVYYPSIIYEAMKKNDNAVWVLPLALDSSTDTINTEKNKLLVKMDVRSPRVEWDIPANLTAEIVYKTLDLSVSLKVEYSDENQIDFSVELEEADNEQLVKAYNDSLGTDYLLLPSDSYNIKQFEFSAGDKFSKASLILNRNRLEVDRSYLLPLKLSSLSTDLIEKTDDIRYVVVTNPKYVYIDVDRSSWKVAFANCQDPWNAPLFHAAAMIDDNPATAWGSYWAGSLASTDDFDYSNKAGYWTCTQRRDIPNMVVVIDMGQNLALGGLGFNKSTDLGHQDLKSCDFYLSDSFTFKPVNEGGSFDNYNTVDDGNSWGDPAFRCFNIPQSPGTFWYYLSTTDIANGVSRGRYLKFHPTESHRGVNLCNLNELYMKELVSVDGNPVK